jgi:glycosyltransferase involved in cell wall biosynthesis
MRLGAQELAPAARDLPRDFELLIASDMLDLPAFLALTRPQFLHTPILVYFHENQLTYPRLRGTKLNSWFGAMNYLSAATANAVAFNSDFHRQDFLRALRTLSGEPNNWLRDATIDEIEGKSSVLPVGVELAWLDALRPADSGAGSPEEPLILWNHRWEFDKAPDVFARAMLRLAADGIAFRIAVAGEPGPNPHPALAELEDALASRIVQFGHLESREAYGRLLWASDIVVSTTRHEFFGVGMVEAMRAGCFPVVPARFNYPALVPQSLHARCLWHDELELHDLLVAAVATHSADAVPLLRASAARFAWERLIPTWDEALSALSSARD